MFRGADQNTLRCLQIVWCACITLVDTPTEIEGSFSNLKTLSQAEVLHRLALDANNLASQGLIQQAPATGSFSISDFLVPGLQTKTWEDWQVADELNPFATTADAQNYSVNLVPMPFQFGLDGVMMGEATWDTATAAAAGSLPSDMAYDEFVFDLSPSHFSTPATINVADLIVGPDSSASSTVISPSDLQMPFSHDTYEDLALANFYGFTEQDDSCIFDSDSGSDLSDVDSFSDDDDEDDDENDDDDDDKVDEMTTTSSKNSGLAPISESVVELEDATNTLALSSATVPEFAAQQTRVAKEDPNKRRMEEALVARINNDLGPEHMSGLFKILRGGDAEDDDEDEELEVDLSRLDETTLVQLYQYVETCCMQTLGSILAAEKEEQERQKKEAVVAALAAAKKAQQEQEALEYARALEMRSTPELSPSHSFSSSSPSVSPSPPHQSSYSATECGSSNNKKRSATNSTSCTYKYERNDVEKQAEALWMNTQHKSKRKRMTNNSPVCMGGGGTGKGQRLKKSMMMDQEEQQLQLQLQLQQQQQQQQQDEENDEIGEDDEIDIVGF
ncbi:hypothetical protein BG015_010694 [Linnemannia schmuckeri]|uniref:NET domain-containing protein n=1 Tax=Linnemannia schmuckeri TaxID=64567 RepID=A0A9P5S8I7_9FUNG|nr:hypothetical protein BG015_010694 [Linnemannia schmuckeri]